MPKRYGVPAILSFFIPGLGQVVKGQFWKGVGMFIGAAIAGALTVVGIGLILYPLVWVWSIYDAYTSKASGD